jgi:hypothetical protein
MELEAVFWETGIAASRRREKAGRMDASESSDDASALSEQPFRNAGAGRERHSQCLRYFQMHFLT